MSQSRMMHKAQQIVDQAKAEAWPMEDLKARLADQFPARGMDTEAHREVRRWASDMYQAYRNGDRAIPSYQPQPEEEKEEAQKDIWALTIASLAVGMKCRIKEGEYYRWVTVDTVTRTGNDLRIILKRNAGPKYRLIEGEHLRPLQNVPFLLDVPAVGWEREYA
jgi:sRNA-binding protein